MSTEITKQSNDQQVAIEGQKRKAWGDMGVIIYRQELQLQVSAQASLSKLEVMPAKIEDVPAAEAALKEVKADCVKLTEERKKITSKFDEVTQRLMGPEKSFSTPILEFSNQIIKIKKDHEISEKKKKDKLDEYSRIKQNLLIAVSNIDAEYKRLVNEKVNTAYLFAFENSVKPEEKADYMDRVCFRISEKHFTPQVPDASKLGVYNTPLEIQTLINEVFVVKPSDYVALFAVELEKRFEDYDVAFNNKQEALKIAQEELVKKNNEITDNQQNAVVSATLECVSTDIAVEPSGFKALKKSYEVDMPETFENAMKILSAFMANKTKAAEKTTVKKWFSFNADSAGKALAKLKSEDNSFAPVGITFKEVDKL